MINFDFDKLGRLVRQTLSGRWIFFLLFCVLLGALVLFWGPDSFSTDSGQSVFVIALLNFNIILLAALLFAVGRNIFRLILDRQNRVVGSKLRQRLVLAFVGLTIIPIVIIFLLASGIINRATAGWFSTQVETIVSSSQDLTRSQIQAEKDGLSRLALQLKKNIQKSAFRSAEKNNEKLASYLENYSFDYLALSDFDNNILAYASRNPADSGSQPLSSSVHLSKDLLKSIDEKQPYMFVEERGVNLTLLSFQRVKLEGFEGLLITAKELAHELNVDIKKIQDAFKEYEQLKTYKNPIKTSYLLTLALITGIILFAAIWFGMYLAREISVPLKRLAEGTAEVAAGNYDLQLPVAGDDELSELVQAFNKMISDLKMSRGESERRRQYLETILNNLAVGVFGFGTTFRVLTVNKAARDLFQYASETEYLGRSAEELFKDSGLEGLNDFISGSLEKIKVVAQGISTEAEINVIIKGQKRRLMATLGRVGAHNDFSGAVLLIDDVTELVRAQQVSVWREVARRLAHEIKNPLTPIKLAAQRLIKNADKKIVASDLESAGKVIVENSDAITLLVDEFSKFGRMPVAEFHPSNLNRIIAAVLESYTEAASDIVYQFIQDNNVPEVALDESQIKRCFANLIDNAVAAIRNSAEAQGKIIIRTQFFAEQNYVQISLCDNGPGIPLSEQSRIFEPYYTTKENGTGLGLAIVSSIIADHHGKIRVFNNEPKGAKFIIELPVKASDAKGRRFA